MRLRSQAVVESSIGPRAGHRGKKVPSRQLTSGHLFIPADCRHRPQLRRAHQRAQQHRTNRITFLPQTNELLPSGGTLEILRGIIARHEVELGLIVSKRGRDIRPSDANDYITGYTLAVDMTTRNLQSKVTLDLPWSAAKGFDGFTPISTAFLPSTDVKDPTELRLTLVINNQLKQDGKTKDMIF
ncbi:hypothetical protein AX14_005492 [Amanita brunnescens Koide BX004]|nr:hypothetical protein AX14_005492 [Amanita brunnescens Koide BX004]